MAMSFDEIHLSEKQISKEILLKLIDEGYLHLFVPSTEEEAEENVKKVVDAFSKILSEVSEHE